jgi:hypothetical protein
LLVLLNKGKGVFIDIFATVDKFTKWVEASLPPPSQQQSVDGHKMHIFTANIPTFQSRYRRYVPITNEFHEFC